MNAMDKVMRASTLIFATLFVAALTIVSQGLDPLPIRFVWLLVVLVKHGALAGVWLSAAAGWGFALGDGLRRWVDLDRTTRLALGVGLLAMLDWLLGWAGWLNMVTATGIAAVGWVWLIWRVRSFKMENFSLPAGLWMSAPALGLLVGAACVAPGALWGTEFGGYDALEYHLQLPAEWERLGAIRGLEHNAYSYLPSLFESAFGHLAIWSSDPWSWAHSAQILHAAMAGLTALFIGKIVSKVTDQPTAGAAAGAIYLATPWTLVTGSLAYNEQAMMMFGAAAVWVLTQRRRFADGLMAGLLCGFAVLCKLTAIGMVVLPMLMVLMYGEFGIAIGAGVVVSFWMLRNFIWAGNPVFPMLPEVFGLGHWTLEQATRWTLGHGSSGDGLGRLFSAEFGLFHGQFGYIVFPLALIGAIITLSRKGKRLLTLALLLALTLQVAFWLAMTHHQSRFLIPLLLPACVLIGIGLSAIPRPAIVGSLIVVALTVMSFGLYLRHSPAWAIGATDLIAEQSPPYKFLNRLPPGSRVYSEGFATPFYVRVPMDYHTVWDTSPLGPSLVKGPAAAAAWLREQGYTHVVIDWNMLDLWHRPRNYGYDPNVSMNQLAELADKHLLLLSDQDTSGSALVYQVKPD